MPNTSTSVLILGLILAPIPGCDSRQESIKSASPQNKEQPARNGITVEADGKRLPAQEEKAIAQLTESMLSEAFGEMLTGFSAKLNDALEITDDIESSLMNPGLNSMEHGDDSSITVYLFRDSSEIKSAKTTEIYMDEKVYIRFCRVPSSTPNPYAIVHHRTKSTNVVRDYFLVYDENNGWQNQTIEITKRPVSFDPE